jgi:hypothetical protein
VTSDKSRSTEDRLNTLIDLLQVIVSDGHLKYYDDVGSLYNIGRCTLIAPGQAVNSTSPAAVTGITGVKVNSTPEYIIEGVIYVSNITATANQAIRLASPGAVSACSVAWYCITATDTISNQGVCNALGSDMSTGSVATGVHLLYFHGNLQFTTQTTFGLNARCVTSGSDNWNLESGSYMHILPVT